MEYAETDCWNPNIFLLKVFDYAETVFTLLHRNMLHNPMARSGDSAYVGPVNMLEVSF